VKIAFFNQHRYSNVLHTSIEIVTHELAHGLSSFGCQIVVYSQQGKNCYQDAIHYKHISSPLDTALAYFGNAIDNHLLQLHRHTHRPFFSSQLHYLTYALQVAKDLKTEKPDIVHIHNFSQVVPIVRALHPQAKIVLHMHGEWLSFLNRAMIERRLEDTDLVVGVSKYYQCDSQTVSKVFSTLPNSVQWHSNSSSTHQITIEKQ
jgi:hypothetical protein